MTAAGRTRIRRWAPAVVWAAGIFGLSTGSFSGSHTGGLLLPLFRLLLPGAAEETLLALHGAVRKLAHFTEYFVLSRLVYRALRDGGTPTRRAHLEAVLFASAYAVMDEFHQSFVPERTAAGADVLIDTLGAAVAQASLIVARRVRPHAPRPLRSR